MRNATHSDGLERDEMMRELRDEMLMIVYVYNWIRFDNYPQHWCIAYCWPLISTQNWLQRRHRSFSSFPQPKWWISLKFPLSFLIFRFFCFFLFCFYSLQFFIAPNSLHKTLKTPKHDCKYYVSHLISHIFTRNEVKNPPGLATTTANPKKIQKKYTKNNTKKKTLLPLR